MWRKLTAVLLSLFILTTNMSANGEHSRGKHDQILELVLFGNEYYSLGKPKETKERINALKSASYLCLDQFNHHGDAELQELKDYGVYNLPGSIKDIDFSCNSDHRAFTHRGWDYQYINDQAHWPIRKIILIETVNKVFNFGFGSGMYFGMEHYDQKCISLSAVIYYVHILQDHLEKKDYKPLIIPLTRSDGHDQLSILDELLKHFEILFEDQMNSRVYKSLKHLRDGRGHSKAGHPESWPKAE